MSEEILSLVRPNMSGPSSISSISAFLSKPLTVKIQSPALLTILENSLRADNEQRVIGALLGTRSEDGSEIDITDSYIVPHEEKEEEITIDEYNFKSLLQSYKRTNQQNQTIGWFQTSDQLDTTASLIHDFFSSSEGSYPHAAIHLTLKTKDSDNNAIIPEIKTFISSSLGGDSGSGCVFVEIPHEIAYNQEEKLMLNKSMENVNKGEVSNLVKLQKNYNNVITVKENLSKINELLDANIDYIEKILNNEIAPSTETDKIGKFLINNLIYLNSNYDGFTKNFNNYVQDTLMIEYLVSSIKAQIELSAKLTTLV